MNKGGDAFARGGLAVALVALIGIALASAASAADESQAASDDSAELAKKLQNPIANLISVPFQNNFEWGAGQGSKGFRYLVNVQPVIPISISEDWNVISRTIMPIIHQTDTLGPTTQDGIGDILQSLFFSPKAPGPGGIIWGAGPVFSFPSASNDLLGTQKFSLGPTAVALRQTGGWTYGALANHVWSVAGNKDRAHVSQTFLQPFLQGQMRDLVVQLMHRFVKHPMERIDFIRRIVRAAIGWGIECLSPAQTRIDLP